LGVKSVLGIFASVIGAGFASHAVAAGVCSAPPASPGAAIHGPVLEVPDGSSLCVATGASPSAWVKVPLSGPRTSRSALMAAAFARNATCTIGADGRGDCRVEGQPLGEALQRPEVVKAAYAWR
jgi:hypothetical protein